jgi:hypothetical protein
MLGKVHINGAINLNNGAKGGTDNLRKVSRAGIQTVGGGVIGGFVGVKEGVGGKNPAKSFSKGAARSMKKTLGNAAYQTQAGREYFEANLKLDSARNRKSRENLYCDRCGKMITEAGKVTKPDVDYTTTADGRILCNDCAALTQANDV